LVPDLREEIKTTVNFKKLRIITYEFSALLYNWLKGWIKF